MSGYLERLQAAKEPVAPAEVRVALLTGQSSFQSSTLSPAQLQFLTVIAPKNAAILPIGFPFDFAFQGAGFRETSLAGASCRNARQVVWALRSLAFQQVVAQRLHALITATSQRLILITGSCGLQLANAAWPALPAGPRVDVIALGPACFGTLRVPAIVVQGRADHWSRLFYRGRVDHRPACGHLEYWNSAEVRALVKGLLR